MDESGKSSSKDCFTETALLSRWESCGSLFSQELVQEEITFQQNMAVLDMAHQYKANKEQTMDDVVEKPRRKIENESSKKQNKSNIDWNLTINKQKTVADVLAPAREVANALNRYEFALTPVLKMANSINRCAAIPAPMRDVMHTLGCYGNSFAPLYDTAHLFDNSGLSLATNIAKQSSAITGGLMAGVNPNIYSQ